MVAALSNRQSIEKLYLLADKSSFTKNENNNNNPKIEICRVWKRDSFFSILGVMRYILKIKPDVVHFNVCFQSFGRSKISNLCGLSLILLCRLFGFQVLAGAHTLADMADLEKFNVKPTIINKIGILVATKIVLSAQNVVVLVKTYGDSLRQRYGHKGVLYIPHGATADENTAKNLDEKIVLIFGHMGPHKGLPVMLEALEKIRAEKNEVKLLVAGTNNPNYPDYLKQFIDKQVPNVEFTGYVPQDKLGLVFKRAHVVVLPYHASSGTSGVFHLACGYSRPVVASNLPEIKEIVDDGASAILVPPGDVEALKDAVLKVLFDEGIADKMSQQNLSFAKKESWSAVAKAYEDAYCAMQHTK